MKLRYLTHCLLGLSLTGLAACGSDSGSSNNPDTGGDENQSPVAVVTANGNEISDQSLQVTKGDEVTFSAAGSTDPDGYITKYAWNYGNETKDSITVSFDAVGTETITLTLTDNDGEQTTHKIGVTVTDSSTPTNTAPVLKLTKNGAAVQDGAVFAVKQGESLSFDASGSSDADNDTLTYHWTPSASGDVNTVTFDKPGTQTVSVYVTDTSNATSATISVTVNVEADIPVVIETIEISGADSVVEGKAINMSAIATDNEGSTYTDVVWSVENGTGQASITRSGLLTAIAEGSVEVIAAKGEVTQKKTVEIIDDTQPITVDSVEIEPGPDSIIIGKSQRYSAVVTYSSGSTIREAVWSVSDETLATVAIDGSVTALAEGVVELTAARDDVVSAKKTISLIPDPDNYTSGIKVYAKGYSHIWAWDAETEVDYFAGTGWPGELLEAGDDGWGFYIFDGLDQLDLLFSNNAAGATENLHIAARGEYWLVNGALTDVDPNAPTAPTVGASPAGAVKPAGTFNVTLKVEGDEVSESSYTIDGTDPKTNGIAYEDGDSIEITLAEGDVVELKLYSKNEIGEVSNTFTFTEGEPVVQTFSWDNATVYFVMTDRFVNGDTSNDHAYGRECDKNGENCKTDINNRPGTFHGGDLKGLTSKVEDGYFTDLGINAIWLTSPVEQLHGWVGGSENGNMKHYGYHGYYALDMSNIDANMGTEQDYRNFIDAAHAKGIRVVQDVILNHAGYETLQDMYEFGFGNPQPGWDDYYYNATDANAEWNNFKDFLGFDDCDGWSKWWGDWVRKDDICGYSPMGGSPLGQWNFNLPDFKTESTQEVALPDFLTRKWEKEGRLAQEQDELDAFFSRTGLPRTPRSHVIKWLTDYIRDFGVDGFRLDTVNNLDIDSVRALADTAKSEFEYFKQQNPEKVLDPTAKFWMTGEAYDHGVNKSHLFTSGNLDSAINFTFPKDGNLGSIISTWASYANKINNDDSFNVLSYISSHDKGLARGNMKNLGTTLLLSPGAVQVYYGDETGRPVSSSGEHGWRSNMNWGENQSDLEHWQKVGQFRNNHLSVGAGSQTDLGNSTVMRSYEKNGVVDKVVIALNGTGKQAISVGDAFNDGDLVRNAYNDETATVSGGSVEFTFENSVVLIEAAE